MTKNLTNKVTKEVIFKEGETFEPRNLDYSSPELREYLEKVMERQKSLQKLKEISKEDLEIYITI